MSKQFITAAFAINNDLKPAEAISTDAAIATTSLLLTMLQQHRQTNARDDIGLTAIGHAARANAAAIEMREALIRAHGAVNIDAKKVGLDEMLIKPDDLPTKDPVVGPMFAALPAAVAADAA